MYIKNTDGQSSPHTNQSHLARHWGKYVYAHNYWWFIRNVAYTS